jgi:hypothetical protein
MTVMMAVINIHSAVLIPATLIFIHIDSNPGGGTDRATNHGTVLTANFITDCRPNSTANTATNGRIEG